MEEIVPRMTEVLRRLWQGRWFGLIVAWVAGLGGAAIIFFTPDKYEATARVYVDTQSILKPLMNGLAVQPNVEQELANLSRTLITRPNVQKLVRMTHTGLTSAREEDKLVDRLMRTVYIKGVGDANLYTIGFADPDPATAMRVVQSLLSIFVESGSSAKANDTGQAKRFIEEQIRTYEQRLTEAENRLKEFKLKNMDLTTPSGADFFASLSTLSENLRQARLQLEEARRSREVLKQQLEDEEQRSELSTDNLTHVAAATPEIDARLSALATSLDELLVSYTDEHPDVINTRRGIKELEKLREAERKRLAQDLEKRARNSALGANAAIPRLKVALAEAEAQIASLQARVGDLERRQSGLQRQAEAVPVREAALSQLNRDYTIQKQNYDALVARRESALISRQMEAATGVADFRVIDPPRVSPHPVAPNRKILIPLALLLSFGAGGAGGYFFSLVRPTFYDNRGLKTAGNRPVLGAITLIPTPAVLHRRRRHTLLFFGGAGGLLALYGLAFAAVLINGIF